MKFTKIAILSLLYMSCADPSLEEPTEEQTSPLYGDIVFTGSDCTPARRAMLEESAFFGRTVAATPAFEQCLREKISPPPFGTGTYRPCMGDHAYSASYETQIGDALWASRTGTNVAMSCSGGGGNASAGIGTWGQSTEAFAWGGWLAAVTEQLSLPLCVPPNHYPGCREAPAPWPMTQAASIMWHEVMHQHGYVHGANFDNEEAKAACGYAGDPTWHFQVNTMPYIVDACVGEVIARSQARCGAIAQSCEQGELSLVESFGGTTCVCRHDPRMSGFGLANASGNDLKMKEMAAVGDYLGGWAVGSSDQILGRGDFDGDGKAEFLIRSAWGLGFVGVNGGRLSVEQAIPTGTTVGSWTVATTDVLLGVGDFDGDGRDELLLRTTANLIIVEVQPSGVWANRLARAWNTALAGHTLSVLDTFRVGDVNGDGHDELILSGGGSAHQGRITIVQNLSGTSFTALATWNPGTGIGGWNKGVLDRLRFVADYNGDGAADFLISSGWGFGTFRWSGSAIQIQQAIPYGYTLPTLSADPSWVPSSADTFLGVADVNGDGASDLLLRSSTRFGVISLVSNTLRTRTSKPFGYLAAGGWRLGSTDALLAALDTDAVPGDELVFKSPWGMGIITFSPGGFTPRTLSGAPKDSVWDGWLLRSTDRVHPVGDTDGDGKEEFLFQR